MDTDWVSSLLSPLPDPSLETRTCIVSKARFYSRNSRRKLSTSLLPLSAPKQLKWMLVVLPLLSVPVLCEHTSLGPVYLQWLTCVCPGSGIGRESALLFAERGARAVVFADQDVAAAEAASEESKGIATAKSYETLALHVDVRDRQSVKAVITAAKENFSRLDYAVNCAGVSCEPATQSGIPFCFAFSLTMYVHLDSTHGCCRIVNFGRDGV